MPGVPLGVTGQPMRLRDAPPAFSSSEGFPPERTRLYPRLHDVGHLPRALGETRTEQVERSRIEALDALPFAIDEGTHVLVTWD